MLVVVFELDATHSDIRDAAHAFARERIAPRARQWDAEERFPHELIPTNIGAGSRIELLVIPDDSDRDTKSTASEPTTVLSDVVVIDAPSAADSLGSVSRGRQLVLGIPEAESDALTEILAASEEQRVRVLIRG